MAKRPGKPPTKAKKTKKPAPPWLAPTEEVAMPGRMNGKGMMPGAGQAKKVGTGQGLPLKNKAGGARD